MYKLIKAKAIHAKQIIPYLTITCYWKEFVEGNDLNQDYESFMLQWVVNPRLPYTTVLVKEGDDDIIYGCVIAATLEQLGTMPDYTPHMHPKAYELFKPWLQCSVADSVVVELFAVAKELRGKGYGAQLYQVAEDLAKKEGKDTLTGFVWACFPDSLITCTRRGFMVTKLIEFSAPVKMPLLYLEKKPEFAALKDYFQSEEYSAEKNMVLKK